MLAGALLLSAKGVVAKLMYAQGADATTVASVRSMLAVPGFWAWAVWRMGWRRMLRVDRRDLISAAGIGFACYYVGAFINFFALTLIDASLERVILFSYPVLVVTTQIIATRRLPPARVLWAVVLTYLGIYLAVGGFAPELLRGNAYGAGLVMLCAVLVALFYLVNARVAPRIGAQCFTTYAMTAAGIGFAAHFGAVGDWSALPGQTATFWWLMALMVVGVTVLPLFLLGEGVTRIGATRSSLITTVGPAATVIMAHYALGERLHPLQLAGSALIVGGIFVLERRRAVAAQ